jgi:hypothetical protein
MDQCGSIFSRCGQPHLCFICVCSYLMHVTWIAKLCWNSVHISFELSSNGLGVFLVRVNRVAAEIQFPVAPFSGILRYRDLSWYCKRDLTVLRPVFSSQKTMHACMHACSCSTSCIRACMHEAEFAPPGHPLALDWSACMHAHAISKVPELSSGLGNV